MLVNAGLARRIGDLVGKLQFTEEEISRTQKSLDATGVSMPNFKDVRNAVAGELEDPIVVAESEAERVDRVLQESAADIVVIQAQARGALLRQRISFELQRLEDIEHSLIRLQSQARGFLVRQQYYENAHTYRQITEWSIGIQMASRGYLVRNMRKSIKQSVSISAEGITHLQAALRGTLVRRHLQNLIIDVNQANKSTTRGIQVAARGYLVRKARKELIQKLSEQMAFVVQCQATARAFSSRRSFDRTQAYIELNESEIIAAQSISRGFRARQAYFSKLSVLRSDQTAYTSIQAISSGFLMRKKYRTLRNLLEYEIVPIADCQALCRGLLSRIDYNSKLIALAHAEGYISDLQAAAKGVLVRRSFYTKLQHYRKNMESVIKVQSFVRARQQGAAYRSLTLDKDPPVSTIKNFIHLLNDSNFDFEEEVAMEQVRKQIVQSIRQNEAAEEHIEQMDIKIALLVKQAIKIDEVIQHQKRMDRGLMMMATESNPFDLKALNKNARRQLENYQRFFYILQTQPVYLARLFSRMEDLGMPEKPLKALESFIMILYGYAQKRREEHFLLKLIRSSIIKEISMSQGIFDFISGQYVWTKILANYTKGAKETNLLKDLLRPICQAIIEDDFVDLESDPLIIYKTITQDEEMRTGRQSQRLANVSQEYAIQDPDTRVMFIKHLRDLRDLTEKMIDAIEANVRNFPYGIRYLAREAFRAMGEHLPQEPTYSLNRVIGHLIYNRYIGPALVSPDQAGIVDIGLTPSHRRNLGEISKMLNQITAGLLFEDGSYLQPLNEFIARSIERLGGVLQEMINIPDAETFYGINELDDVIATKRPIIYIKASDIFSIHSTIFNELVHIASEDDDPLNETVRQLGAPPTRVEDMMIMSISDSEIALTLDPKAVDVDDPEADERALFMQTKRYLLYIIRVQSGPSLLDILVEPITEADEYRWHEILTEELTEQNISRSAATYSESMPQDISQMSYPVMKRECLENIVKLEQLGWITRDNHYQELLNRIADDIRTQNRRRIERQYELGAARHTLENLVEKRLYLDSQLKSYNDYIEQAMMSLQSKKGKKKTILPFTKQYFHMRDLQKSGKVPKFGSRKYSASKLYYKGILVSILNENPPFDKIDMTISSDQIGEFKFESSYQGIAIPGANETVQLDDLLQAQFNKAETIDVFQGKMTLRVSLMLNLVFKHFFSQ